MATDEVIIGKVERVFIEQQRVRGLKRAVCVALAKQSMLHHQAAKRAGVSRVYWSRVLGSKRMTPTELETLARGCGMSVSALMRDCGGK